MVANDDPMLAKAYEKAIEQYRHEHDRWRHWALFFFGAIAAVFLVHERSKEVFSLWAAFGCAAFISAFWTFAAVSTRISTRAWEEVLLKLEEQVAQSEPPNPSFLMMQTYKQCLKNKKVFWKEIGACFTEWRGHELFSVTKSLLRIGILSTGLFVFLFLYALVRAICECG